MFKLFTNKVYVGTQVVQWALSLVHIYITWREYAFTKTVHEVPGVIQPYMSGERYARIRQANESKLFFEIISNFIVLLVQILWSDELSHLSLWNLSKSLSGSSNESMITFVFIALITAKDFLFALPLWLFVAFKMHPDNWMDTIQIAAIHFCMEVVSQCVILSIFNYGYSRLPAISKSKMIYSNAAAIVVLFLVQQFSFPVLFGRYLVPLEEPGITSQLEPFLDKMKFPKNRIFLFKMDNPREMPNAFTLGSWFLNNEMIIVTDNVIGKNKYLNDCCTHKEVVSIILHELGHVYYGHVIKTEVLDFVIAVSTSIAFIYLHEDYIFQSFGFLEGVAPIVNILIRLDILAAPIFLTTLFYMVQVRSFEYQADFFSSTFSKEAFQSALVKMHLINAHDLQTHDTLYSVWNLDHPCLIERLKYIEDA